LENKTSSHLAGRSDQRTRAISRVLWVTLALNWLVAAVKVSIGLLAGNLTVIADGFHSILDGANNIIALVAMYFAARPPDEDHPYGHRKFEHVAAMFIGGLVMLLCYETVTQSVSKLSHAWKEGAAPAAHSGVYWWYFALVLSGVGVNLFVAWYENHQGNRLRSPLLRADARHTLSDSALTLLAVISLAFSNQIWWLDGVLALGVGALLLIAAVSILNDNIATMTDRNRLDPAHIREVAEGVDGVLDAHQIRSHGMENDIHLDLHIVVDERLGAREVVEIEDRVRRTLKDAFPQIGLVAIRHETPDEQGDDALDS
jgi:cation diffusion facilitator family transporter